MKKRIKKKLNNRFGIMKHSKFKNVMDDPFKFRETRKRFMNREYRKAVTSLQSKVDAEVMNHVRGDKIVGDL